MALPGTFWIYGTATDCDGSVISDCLVEIKDLTNDQGTASFTTGANGKYQINIQDVADEDDKLEIKFTLSNANSTEHIELYFLDLDDVGKNIDHQFECCEEFDSSASSITLAGSSYTIELIAPTHGNVDGQVVNSLSRFPFWSGRYAVYNKELNSVPLILAGVDYQDENYMDDFKRKHKRIFEMMDLNEEIEITGINEYIDGIYVIEDYRLTTANSKCRFYYVLSLKYVRDLTT